VGAVRLGETKRSVVIDDLQGIGTVTIDIQRRGGANLPPHLFDDQYTLALQERLGAVLPARARSRGIETADPQ
jgi:hypothetical protein